MKPVVKDANLQMLCDAMAAIVIRDGFGEAMAAGAIVLARTIRMGKGLSESEYHNLLVDLTDTFARHVNQKKVIN